MNSCKHDIPKGAFVCKPAVGITIVIIPAQLGDSDGLYAPKIGDYKNTLVKYEADTKVFLYDKDGNWTLVGTSVVPGVDLDTELNLGSTNGVQNKVITKAINDTNDRIDVTGGDIVLEAEARENADGILQGHIDDEETARKDADNTLQGHIDDEVSARTGADLTLQDNIDAEALARANAVSGVETKINRTLINDLVMTADANNVTFTEQKINPLTGDTSAEQDVLPAASATTAGTISASEYQSLVNAEELVNAILEGAAAVTGISATPTQQELTDAWLLATGSTTLINRASLFDVDNDLIWTYYTNTSEWYSAVSTVSFDPFTNSTLGAIKGSTTDGNVAANADGTGTVSGWASLVSTVSGKADSSSLATVATSGLYSDLTGTPAIPTVNDSTITITNNGTNVGSFTTNAASASTIALSAPVITMTTTDPGEGTALADNNFIAVYDAS